MSHHLDSPLARQDIRLDITDLYVFRGDVGTVFIINVCHSIFGPIPSPGFHPEGMYEFKVDIDGNAIEDVTFRVVFKERDASGNQEYALSRLEGPDAADASAAGTLVLEGRTGLTRETPSGVRAWAGKAADPFWIEPDVLHAVGHAFQDGTRIDLSGWNPLTAKNLFKDQTVYSMVLEVPDRVLLGDSVQITEVGVWAVATLATDAGGWRSINRVGIPMIHPLFTQFNDNLGDALNAGTPLKDFSTYGEAVIASVARVVEAYGSASDPIAYGNIVAERLFPNILPYTVGSPAVFGFAKWNGRSLVDDVANVMFSLAANRPVDQGIDGSSVGRLPGTAFPYVPTVE